MGDGVQLHPGHRQHHPGMAYRDDLRREELRKLCFLCRSEVSWFVIDPENLITWGKCSNKAGKAVVCLPRPVSPEPVLTGF